MATVRRDDHDRYLCALFAHGPARAGLLALYAFNSEVARTRESVSEPGLGEIRLQWWRETITGIVEGAPRQHSVARALARAHARRPISESDLIAVIDGRTSDLADSPFGDMESLHAYAFATGGVVSRLALGVLGNTDPEKTEAATAIGVAWALTGVIRALAFHARAGRVLLPATLMADAGLERRSVIEGRDSAGLRRVIGVIADRARGELVSAGRRVVDRAGRPVFLLDVLCDAYLRRLDRAANNPFDPRLRISPLGRQVRLMMAVARRRA